MATSFCLYSGFMVSLSAPIRHQYGAELCPRDIRREFRPDLFMVFSSSSGRISIQYFVRYNYRFFQNNAIYSSRSHSSIAQCYEIYTAETATWKNHRHHAILVPEVIIIILLTWPPLQLTANYKIRNQSGKPETKDPSVSHTHTRVCVLCVLIKYCPQTRNSKFLMKALPSIFQEFYRLQFLFHIYFRYILCIFINDHQLINALWTHFRLYLD